MHIDWQRVVIEFLGYLRDNRLPISLGAAALASAAVKTMPGAIPSTAQDWWSWFSDWAHQVCNTKSDRQAVPLGK